MPRIGWLSSRLDPERNLFADSDQQALWRRTLQSCGGDATRADIVLTAQLLVKSPSLAPLSRSKDWSIRHPGPEAQLVKWLRESRGEWVASLPKRRHAPCEHCGQPVVLTPRRRRVWCSELCANAWYHGRRPKVQHPAKPCTECGNTFEPVRADSVYCSQACRQRAYRHRAVPVPHIRHGASETAPIETASEMCSAMPWRAAALPINRHRQSPLGRAA
jgi:hypothetical protein